MSFQKFLFNQKFHHLAFYAFKKYPHSNRKPFCVNRTVKITCHYCSSSSPSSQSKSEHLVGKEHEKKVEDWGDIIARWYKQYQDFVGISKVYEAQDKVSLYTNNLFEVQTRRRRLQKEVEDIHHQLLATHQRITKSELYSEDHYSLFEKARQLNGTLKTLQAQFVQTEEEERGIFTQLSTAIKYCHEQERTQSILISVVSATLGALITSVNNWVRIKEIKDHSTVLHKEIIDNTNNLHTVIANTMNSISNYSHSNESQEAVSSSEETLVKSVQTVVRNELKQILGHTESFNEGKNVNDVSYFKIAGSMFSGALVGIIITYNLLGGGGS
ncbi:Coiled-coil domain-containing protein 51 [Armadillidium nasatum]|uniref:Coiled-coil domain-containing protein 51 n=1 Tax=Armadillidium nasatum TaxID=96803 RepID=A0A5N5SSG3_9CRUS|nr:Coiled-coil domain-containing protein 51 [Armadillidium nasatum]KAB7506645.1 Coiled-coil domain-containing protein 51 [Armadillidium nasatum]